MPATGRAERIGFLRAAIGRIEAGADPQEVRELVEAGAPHEGVAPMPADVPATAARRAAKFFEIGPAAAGDCGAATGFALMLAGRLAGRHGGGASRPLVWIGEDFGLAEQGAPYAPGLAAYGFAPHDLVLIRAGQRMDLWRATEEALKSRACGAIIIEPAAMSSGAAGNDLQAVLRRLHAVARGTDNCAILLRPPSRTPYLLPSPLRFEVSARTGAVGADFAEELGEQLAEQLAFPLPGLPRWRIRHTAPAGSLTRPLLQELAPLLPGFADAGAREQPFGAGLTSSVLPERSRRAALSVHMHQAA